MLSSLSRRRAEYEIVEINGLTVKRRRRERPAPTSMDPPGLPNDHQLKTPYAVLERSSGATQRSPNVDEFEISEALYDKLSTRLQQLPLGASCSDCLMALCTAICQAEVEILANQGKHAASQASDRVFTSFLTSLAAAARDGTITFAPAQDGASLVHDAEELKVDLAARKAGLRNRLQFLEKEEQQWKDILAQVASVSVAEHLDSTTAHQEGQDVDKPSTEYAAEEIEGLKALQQDLPRILTQQVDGLCMLLGTMEDLIDRTNATTERVRTSFHHRRFDAFPYINSPRNLIRAIVQHALPSADDPQKT
jgi:hypothetical protein